LKLGISKKHSVPSKDGIGTPHDHIPIHVQSYAINDDPPTEEEVVEAIHKLKTGKAAGASGIKTEHLKR